MRATSARPRRCDSYPSTQCAGKASDDVAIAVAIAVIVVIISTIRRVIRAMEGRQAGGASMVHVE